MVRKEDLPPGLAEKLKKTGQKPENFVSLVAPYRPGDENIVLEGEDAKRFVEMRKHNETCRGANASQPCEPCARRNEGLFRALDNFGEPTKGDFECPQCEACRDSEPRLNWHIKMAHQEPPADFD